MSEHHDHYNHSNSFNIGAIPSSSHSVSYVSGGTQITSDNIPNTLEGTLSILSEAAKKAKKSLDEPATDIAIREVAFAEDINNILKNSGGKMKSLFPNGKLSWNGDTNANGSKSHFNSAASNNENNPISLVNLHSNTSSWSQGHRNYHGNTASLRSNTNTNDQYFPKRTLNLQKDDSMLKSNAIEVLDIINSGVISSSHVPSFGTWSSSGHNNSHHNSWHKNCLRALKKDISNFTKNAVNIINKVQVCNFKYKNDEEQINHIGFIADDTPEELSTYKKDCMDVISCIGILLKAVQELNERLEKLENNF